MGSAKATILERHHPDHVITGGTRYGFEPRGLWRMTLSGPPPATGPTYQNSTGTNAANIYFPWADAARHQRCPDCPRTRRGFW